MSTVRNFLVLSFYFLTVNGVALLCLVWAVSSVERGEYFTTAVVLGIALAFVGLETSLILIMRGRVSPRVESNDLGTTIRPDRIVDGVLQWATIALVAALATYAIFAPQGKIDIPLPYGNRRMWVVVAIVGALTGIANVLQTFRRGGLSFQRLDPQGFELGQGVTSVHGQWDDITDISDRRPGKSAPFRATLFVTFRDGRIRTQAIDSYTPGGRALRRWVRYYWLYPDRRDELTDGRAIARLDEYEGSP